MFLLSSAERTTITTHQSFQVSYTVDIQSSVITLYVQYTLYVLCTCTPLVLFPISYPFRTLIRLPLYRLS